MPLLFKNGKLVINDIDQLVFSDDPDSCRCCPGLCECPPDADYAVPKYVEDVSFSISNLADTYFAETNYQVDVQWSDAKIDKYIRRRRFDVSGISALNGTWPLSLESISNPEMACVQPDPFPACAFDANMDCHWTRGLPVVPLTGSFSNYEFTNLQRSNTQIEVSESFFITGWAMGTPPGTIQNTGSILLILCLREGSYTGDVKRTFRIQSASFPTTSIQETQTIINNVVRIDCQESFPISVGPSIIQGGFPESILNLYEKRGFLFCNEPSGQVTQNAYWCNDQSNSSASFSFPRCQGSGTETESIAPPPPGVFGFGWTQTASYDYDLSGMTYDINWNYTLNPP
jgi:hypothetical protein